MKNAKHIFVLIALWLSVAGCQHRAILNNGYDGVYDAQPFNLCGCPGRVLLSIQNNNVKLYGPHHNLAELGKLSGDRWPVWSGYDVHVHRTDQGLSMQIPGEDAFLELPRISMTEEQFNHLPVDENMPLEKAISPDDAPPLFHVNSDRQWELERLWNMGYGYGPLLKVEKLLKLDIEIDNQLQGVVVSLSSISDEAFGLVFNPTNYHGSLLISGRGRLGEVIYITPDEDPSFHMVKPKQTFIYLVPFNDINTGLGEEIEIHTNDIVFAEMKIDFPEATINSECKVVGLPSEN